MENKLFTVFKEDELSRKVDNSSTNTQDIKKKLESGEYNLVIDQARYPLAALSAIFDSYNLNPDYQRNKVWDQQRKSKLIESLIMNIPIPPIFLYETSPNKYEVMDGLQRISTIIDFFNNKFELRGLEVWSELNNFYYKDLIPEVQDAINRRYLSGSVILNDSRNDKEKQDALKRLVFERLNTGGIQLTRQEIRNAVNTSEMNSMINKIADQDDRFKELWKLGAKSSTNKTDRMDDREMVLRFFAYKDLSYNRNTKFSTLQVLDYYSNKSVYFEKEKVLSLEKYILKVLDYVNVLFGSRAFNKKPNVKNEKMIFDTVMLACSRLVDNDIKLPRKTNIENNILLKYDFFESKKELFNGKYTAFSNVQEREEEFYNFLIKEIFNGSEY